MQLLNLDSVNHGFMMFGATPAGMPTGAQLYIDAQNGKDPLAEMGLSSLMNLDSVNHGFMMFGATPKGAPTGA